MDLELLFKKNNIDTEVIYELDFFIKNQTSRNVYQLLLDKFQVNTLEKATFLFNLVEIYNLVESALKLNKKTVLSKSKGQMISWGCAFAIAGTVAVTAGATFVTGGASLILFLATKGLATVAIVEACGDGWGDI